MTVKMIRSSKQNPCPVCGRIKDGDCSWYADGQTVLCKTYVDGLGHNEQKWHYNGSADTGFQGKFVLKTEKAEPAFKKASRPQSEKHYQYPDRTGNNLVRVTRKDDGAGNKSFYQSHWDGSKWVKGCPKELRKDLPIYRYAEVREAIEREERVFVVEGEGVADRLWELGIPATTTIGGSGGYTNYGNYSEDLKGARLVLAPDRDANGLKYIANFDRDFPTQIEGYYLAGTEGLWRKPSGGMDIGDDIQDHSYTKDQLLDRIISTDKYRELTTAAVAPKTDKKGKTEKIPSPLKMSKQVFSLLFDNRIRFDASVKQYWRYDGKGLWVTCSDEYIFGAVQELLEQLLEKLPEESVRTFSPSYVRNTIEFARKDFLQEGWTEASNLLYMPFTNGVLELKTGKLLPHSPDYGFTWQLPRSYSPTDAKWGNISQFLDIFTKENSQLREIAIAFCAAILTGRADLQKFLYLFGSGANGKGAFMALLSMLVGKENTHSTTIADLNENRFESANLKNKRLVLMTDEDKRVGGLSVFKSATGQDPIRYERKGKDASNFIFKGLFVIAANAPTFVGDSNYAIKRRKLDFPCLARIPERDRRDLTPEFEADLTAFTTYLLSLPDYWVTDTIRGASSVEAVKQLNWEMTVREDSIAAFYSDCLIIDPKASIACGTLYKAYQSYCEDSGLKTKSINNFTPSLIELCNDSLGQSIERKRSPLGRVVSGLRLRETWEIGEESSTHIPNDHSNSPIKNENFSPESDRATWATRPILGAGLEGYIRAAQSYMGYTNTPETFNSSESEVKTDEDGNITRF